MQGLQSIVIGGWVRQEGVGGGWGGNTSPNILQKRDKVQREKLRDENERRRTDGGWWSYCRSSRASDEVQELTSGWKSGGNSRVGRERMKMLLVCPPPPPSSVLSSLLCCSERSTLRTGTVHPFIHTHTHTYISADLAHPALSFHWTHHCFCFPISTARLVFSTVTSHYIKRSWLKWDNSLVICPVCSFYRQDYSCTWQSRQAPMMICYDYFSYNSFFAITCVRGLKTSYCPVGAALHYYWVCN